MPRSWHQNERGLMLFRKEFVMDDQRTKAMCKAVYLHVLAGKSMEAVSAELGLPILRLKRLFTSIATGS